MNERIINTYTELFADIPEKELLMYRAVIQLIQEDYDINNIKVSDITKRAGIGKGTAYEYFSSKEEIIVKAIIYDTYLLIKEVEEILFHAETDFAEKYMELLKFLEKRIEVSKCVGVIVRMLSGTFEIGESYRRELMLFQQQCPSDFLDDLIDAYMEQGLKEGCFAEGDVYVRRHAFITQIVGYIFLLLNKYFKGEWSKEQARKAAYRSMIVMINHFEEK